jgi:hypothetical protein
MKTFMSSSSLQKQAALAALFFVPFLILLVLALLDHQATSWIESPKFQDLLNRETSKGLKLTAAYAPLHRVGQFGIQTDSFSGTAGYKTIVTIQAQQITGAFNPLGVILKRWEIDSIHIQSGSVMLQTSEPTPGAPKGVPWPPWWALFWPYRVHIADVKVDDANILWKLENKDSGIYDTRLEVTPNAHDFEYDARGGQFRTPITPVLTMTHAHLLVRKPRLYCGEFLLGDDPAHPEQYLRVEGDAGLQDDRSMRLKVDLAALKVSPWLPENLRPHVEGQMNGHFDYTSSGTGLETGSGMGNLAIVNGVLRNLPQIREYVTVTGSPDPGDMPLKVCQANVSWKAGAISADNIEAECEGVFRVTGTITIAADKTLSGQIELGLSEAYLRWLPTARSAIFTREEGAYHFTTIHFSGTSQKPVQDLSPRIVHEVGKSPLLALKLFFNQAGAGF